MGLSYSFPLPGVGELSACIKGGLLTNACLVFFIIRHYPNSASCQTWPLAPPISLLGTVAAGQRTFSPITAIAQVPDSAWTGPAPFAYH